MAKKKQKKKEQSKTAAQMFAAGAKIGPDIINRTANAAPERDVNQKSIELMKLIELLGNESALAAKLLEALDTGRWLVTVHFQKKYTPADEHDLHHSEFQKGYPKQDVVSSLKCIASSFAAKEFPTAALADETSWH